MSVDITIDGAGRIVIPKAIRDALHIAPGDTLVLDREGEGMTLRPRHPEYRMVKKHGFWVRERVTVTGNLPPIDIVDLVRQDREDRIQKLIGPVEK